MKHHIYQRFQRNKNINLLFVYYHEMRFDMQVFLDMQKYGTVHQYRNKKKLNIHRLRNA